MDDATYALYCAMLLSPELTEQAMQAAGSISLPQITSQSDWALTQNNQIDGAGRALDVSNRGVAGYRWSPQGEMILSSDPGKSHLAHEMTHRLQHLAGMDPGRNHDSDQRRAIEAQAYAAERAARFQCLTPLGAWDTDKLEPQRSMLMQPNPTVTPTR